MKIEPGKTPDQSILKAGDPPAKVLIDGVSASELASFFGKTARRDAWARPGRVVEASLPGDSRKPERAPDFERDLHDGRVEMHSGAPSRLTMDSNHREPRLQMPESLLSLVAQQWARLGYMALHAAAIEIAGLRLLVVGDSCTGKSTLALAAMACGGKVVSDDWVLLQQDGKHVTASALRSSMQLRTSRPVEALLTELDEGNRRTRPSTATGRLWLDLSQTRTSLHSLQIDQVLFLSAPTGERDRLSRFRRISPLQARAALVASGGAILFSSRFDQESRKLQRLASALEELPLRLGATGDDVWANASTFWDSLSTTIYGTTLPHP